MNTPPGISIVIPCYKGAKFLPQAIESCLRQTMPDFEVIVVDDASPDDCADIAARYAVQDKRVRLIKRSANGGVSEAFNTGFRVAQGTYFTRLAQDDIFTEDALATICHSLTANPAIGLVYGDCLEIDETANVTGRVIVPNEPANALLMGNQIGLGVAWRRDVWEAIGEFHSEFDASEDYEYWLRVWDRFPIQKIENKILVCLRQHQAMGSYVYCQKQERATLRILRDGYPKRLRPIQRALYQRKAISRTLYSASFDYRRQSRHAKAMWRLMQSFITWPLPYGYGDVAVRFSRLKSLYCFGLSLVRG